MEGGNAQHAVIAVVEHFEGGVVAVVDNVLDNLPERKLRAVLHIADLAGAAHIMIALAVGVDVVKRQLARGDHIEDIHQIRRFD